ncbi:MAG: rSAM-modified peptide [Tenuifilaceae bacterium]|jgi:hypothetical protein|nr:rSAM-modified peptide [Tenuifilaceae bacterium]NHB70162.1 rSAM-modified peptide [Perlabentimonas gracilis]
MKFSDFKNSKDLLSQEQMKRVIGGSGTCGYAGPVVNGKRTVICGVSKEAALFMFDGGGDGSNWCCDSCGTSTYCGS